MTDARQEDRERILGQPIEAMQPGWCDGCGKRILKRELIVDCHGNWVHAEGSCADGLEAKLAQADGGADRPWRVRVPGTIMRDGLGEQEALEYAARLEAGKPADAFGHAWAEQYDEPSVCPTCGGDVGTDGTAL